MKNTIKITTITITLVAVFVLILSQCTKTKNSGLTANKSNPAKLFLNAASIIPGGYDYDVAFWVDQNYNFFDSTNSIVANTNTSFDTTVLNNLSVNSTNYNVTNGLFNIMRMPLSLVNSVFGNTTTISSSGGSSFAGFSETLYVPSLFTPSFSGFTVGSNGVSASKSLGFTISINVDNSNTHDNLIFIRDLNNPTNNLELYLPYNVASKTFSGADLSQFPVGAKLDFAIARGNVKYKTHNGTEIQFRAGVIQHITTFELLP